MDLEYCTIFLCPHITEYMAQLVFFNLPTLMCIHTSTPIFEHSSYLLQFTTFFYRFLQLFAANSPTFILPHICNVRVQKRPPDLLSLICCYIFKICFNCTIFYEYYLSSCIIHVPHSFYFNAVPRKAPNLKMLTKLRML